MLHLEQTPGLISLLAGKPHSSTFPITSLTFTLRDPIDPSVETPIHLTQAELDEGLQYGPTTGIPPLTEWVYGLQKAAHGRDKGEGWSVTIGNGAQDLIYKVRRTIRAREIWADPNAGRDGTREPRRRDPDGSPGLRVSVGLHVIAASLRYTQGCAADVPEHAVRRPR